MLLVPFVGSSVAVPHRVVSLAWRACGCDSLGSVHLACLTLTVSRGFHYVFVLVLAVPWLRERSVALRKNQSAAVLVCCASVTRIVRCLC